MRSLIRTLLLAPLLVAGASAFAQSGDGTFGTWRNNSSSVHIQARRCGASMCGKVVWASAKAIADARRGGTPNLVGLDLFRDFRKDRRGRWRGRVFVPDLNRTFSGTVVVLDANTVKGTGCALGGVICRSQTLTRIR
ncbi:MAG: DUF2147 domain-containing protein [Sphingomonas sp.]|uniref:DUF2147 domain-containing protein n=1 Tax=Sphingomonas sp. TaxID=28214 RepID=UPI001B28FDCB|nr:DUF2147 domain-containing protein [Sphingomonas sp.]MBO9622096.1 DUF2147 domain-containing protein [Sphingomonas sp.]